MTNMIKLMTLGGGFAALAAATPATAQYYPGYGYGNNYGYNNNVTQIAAQQCQAAVQNRLSYRTNNNGILGAILGTSTSGRVLGVTQVTPRRNTVRVRGVASTGRMAYNQYGMGYYGTLGANYQPDLTFSCDVDYRGYVRDVDINRR
ncbi:MAG TPA: hypothetical protein VM531_02740 [Sphingomicrobium sp.]|jgi:hypothetical protein|nr:hypothetical protein [Sphingomicrobium sp.]